MSDERSEILDVLRRMEAKLDALVGDMSGDVRLKVQALTAAQHEDKTMRELMLYQNDVIFALHRKVRHLEQRLREIAGEP